VKLSVPLRIILVHLVFTIGAAALAVLMVQRSFQGYYARWQEGVSTLPAEQLFQSFANEVARSLLLRLKTEPEVRERDQKIISEGLHTLLKEVRSIDAVIVLDRDLRIQYASQPNVVDLAYTDPDYVSFYGSDEVQRRQVSDVNGQVTTEVMYPVYSEGTSESGGRGRLGSLLVRYRPDPALLARLPQIRPPSFLPGDFTLPLVLFLAAVAGGGILIAALIGVPVRKLDRALAEYRARGYHGGIDPRLGLDGELASTVHAINELGGRFEALDSRGRERERLLATLAESLEDGMLAVDARGEPMAWNAAALRILVSKGWLQVGATDEARETELGKLRDAIRKQPALVRDATVAPELEHRAVDLRREDNTRVRAQITLVPFQLRPGVEATLLLIRDLSTLQKVETHLLEAGRFAMLAHLAGGIAHEIRNPLHSIGVNASVLEQYIEAPVTDGRVRAMRESLTTISEETRRLTDLLNNYLGLLRSSPAAGPVDIRDVCRRVSQLLSYAALKSHVKIQMEGEDDLPPIEGVPDRLQQAVLNLVLNAIQAMPSGGVVAIRTGVSEGLVNLTVSDTGPGIPQEIEEGLFESRVTTKPGGSGLGLPLVRMIAEAHGGSVRYHSAPGKGAAFTLVLPPQKTPVASRAGHG
jgi:signal transduction histidine kinase